MLLLDTHILVWWRTADRRLGRNRKRRIDRQIATGVPVGLSAISLWEMALLGERGRISAFSAQARWLEQIETDVHLFVYPITAAIASDAARLPESFPRDPADRIIAATARCESLELATADERIRQSRLVDVV